MDLGTVLIKLRSFKGYSQEAVANEIGVNYKTYGRYESGKNEMKASALKAVAEFYNMSVDDMLNWNPDDPTKPEKKYKPETIPVAVHEKEVNYLTRQIDFAQKTIESQQEVIDLLKRKDP
jgi:transcriptional regulator with XRE-family HTH domain